jgi:hypothetical protein
VVAWLRLLRVAQRGEQDLGEQLKGWGLNNAQFDVLAHVGANEGVMQQELADSLLVTKGNIAQLLDRMQKRGLIERRPEGRTNGSPSSQRKSRNNFSPCSESSITPSRGIHRWQVSGGIQRPLTENCSNRGSRIRYGRRRTRTSSGGCAGAVVTLGSSPPSSTGCTPWARSCLAGCSSSWPTGRVRS